MLAGSHHWSPRRAARALLVLLSLAATLAFAEPPSALDETVAESAENGRYLPQKALAALLRVELQARAAPLRAKAEFLYQLGNARRRLGQHDQALALAEELITLGKEQHDRVALAKGLLGKACTLFAMNELAQSHRWAWEGEQVASTTDDMALRAQATITSGQAYAEDGNFPLALGRLQAAVALARQSGKPAQRARAFDALACLYILMKEYDKGFEALGEAVAAAEKTGSPGRMASLKNTEYALAIATGQPQRALKALQGALALERRIGAQAMIATTLVNLSDNYLQLRDYPAALDYATQALDAARRVHRDSTEATAHVNIGQAYMGMGRLVDGKRSFEAGMARFEKAGNKPELQSLLTEYGAALERSGDMAGAVAAYHRERALSNELFEQRRQKAIWELQEKYEAEKKQRRIELLSRENQVKSTEIDNRRLEQRVWWLLVVVFALAAAIVAILYRKVRKTNAQLNVSNLELKRQSSRDPLTSLYNRRHFQEFMRAHQSAPVRVAETPGEDMVGALFLLDVDHFKHVNDTCGHAAGDAVLKSISENLRVILRETDMIVRWGGEEFLAFLPAVPRSGLEEIARRVLNGISAQTIDYKGCTISVNVSIGFAPFPLAPGARPLPWERAVNLVDMALYLAKGHGRNRAYGVRGFADFERTSMEYIEQDLERAWRAGFVDLSIVMGERPGPQAAGMAHGATRIQA